MKKKHGALRSVTLLQFRCLDVGEPHLISLPDKSSSYEEVSE
jgi:hypothetical protein